MNLNIFFFRQNISKFPALISLRGVSIAVLLLFIDMSVSSANFYVSGEGNDSWDGRAPEYRGGTTGPWKTLDKVNQEMHALGGHSVFFRCSDRFEGNLEITGKGITFGVYGEGNRPLLTGSRFLESDWAPVAGHSNVYKTALPANVEEVTILLRNNVSLPLGRTPNGDLLTDEGYYTFSSRTVNSVTDPVLSVKEDLVGSEIVLRKNNWTYYSYRVNSINGSAVGFPNQEEHTKKKGDENLQAAGYFFQKHIATLDTEGEWFFDTDKGFLYLYAEKKPGKKEYEYTSEPVVVSVVNSEKITIQGLRVCMAASLGIELRSGKNVQIRDCEIELCGREGIRLHESTALIEDNSIRDCLGVGIHALDNSKIVVTRNTVSNIGMIPGRGWISAPYAQRRNGIMAMGGNSEVSYNRLKDIGYIGIQHAGGNNLVCRNFIEDYNRVTFDGGAIYTHGDQKGTVVEENIILRGMANPTGLASKEKFFSTGIQCDAKTQNIVIRYNTIAYPQASTGTGCIHLNFNAVDNLVKGNILLTHGTGISTYDRDAYEREPGEPSPPSMSGNRFEENIIVRMSDKQPGMKYNSWAAILLNERQQCDMENQGIFLNNVCAVPFSGAKVILESIMNCNDNRENSETWFDNASDWNHSRSYATGNLDAPVRLDGSSAPEDFIHLFYNDSDISKVFTLPPGSWLDPKGNSLSGKVAVAPWRSVVVFKTR